MAESKADRGDVDDVQEAPCGLVVAGSEAACLLELLEASPVEAFVTETAVEALDEAILHGAAGSEVASGLTPNEWRSRPRRRLRGTGSGNGRIALRSDANP